MGFMDQMKDAMDVTRKIELAEPKEPEEIFELLKNAPSLGKYEQPVLKKGLMGKTITYPETVNVTVTVTVKKNVVTITKTTQDHRSTLTVGGVASFNVGKKNASLQEGSDYFKGIADDIEAVLKMG